MEYFIDAAVWLLENRHDIVGGMILLLCAMAIFSLAKISKKLDETSTECMRLRARMNADESSGRIRIRRDVTIKKEPAVKFALNEIEVD